MKNTFNQRLIMLRQQQNMTQEDLAKKLGLAISTISMYERGSRIPSLRVLEKIADFFNVDMDFLLGKKDRNTVLHEIGHFISHDTKSEKIKLAARNLKDMSEEDVDFILKMMEKIKK